MLVSIIVAKTQNNAIGYGNKLLCKIPKDMKYFHDSTVGHVVIMGRKTFESIGKPLPGRENIVITKNREYKAQSISVVNNFEEALTLANKFNETEAFVIGGGEIYEIAIKISDRIYLTEIHATLPGDTFFPKIDLTCWREIKRVCNYADDFNKYNYDFVYLEKNKY